MDEHEPVIDEACARDEHGACPPDAPCECDCHGDTEIAIALDDLDDLLENISAVSDENLTKVDAWANNIQLDIMRETRRRAGARERAARKETTPDGR